MRYLILVIFISLFILIRSIHFSEFLNFSFDQAWASTRALEIWRNKEFTLVGPGSSIIVQGKQILQGSITYYFQLVFLLIGNFDPIISSYLFMLFAAFMSISLYFGVYLLFNETVAFLTLSVYSFFPLFIDFTRFFFGPNFQITLIPLLLLFMGLFKRFGKKIYLFLIFLTVGIISQFHFATLIFYPLLFTYYLINFRAESRKIFKLLFVSLAGFIIGFSPILLFEIKNKFYNLKVFIEYLKYARSPKNFQLIPHRYLPLSLVLIPLILGRFIKLVTNKLVFILTCFLIILDLFIYFPKPKQAFGMAPNWNFLMEKKAYEIIKKESLKDFNVANLIYDNLSVVVKYQMRKDNYLINFDDYYHNHYLFVLDKSEKNLSSNPAYEIKTFSPRKKLKQWKLNNTYNLYLFERIKSIK